MTYGTLPAVGVRPALGRWFSPEEDAAGTPETVILTYGYWQRRFAGSAAVIGSAVTIDSRPRLIIGVMPQSFRFLNTDPAVILPQRFEGPQLLPNDVHAYIGIARLKPGVSLAQANADVGRMLPIWIKERGTNANVLNAARFGPAVRPVKQDVIGDVGPVLWLLMGTIGIVLIIACANVANLLLVRAEGRRQRADGARGAGRGLVAISPATCSWKASHSRCWEEPSESRLPTPACASWSRSVPQRSRVSRRSRSIPSFWPSRLACRSCLPCCSGSCRS